MTYKGRVRKGVVVLDYPSDLPDGAVVLIELAEDRRVAGEECAPTPSDHYLPFIGALDGMPEDWSENHDKYLSAEHKDGRFG